MADTDYTKIAEDAEQVARDENDNYLGAIARFLKACDRERQELARELDCTKKLWGVESKALRNLAETYRDAGQAVADQLRDCRANAGRALGTRGNTPDALTAWDALTAGDKEGRD